MAFKIAGVEISPIPSKVTTLSDRSTYTLLTTDIGDYLKYDGTTDLSLTVPVESEPPFADNGVVTVEQSNTGQITFVGAQGVTITSKADLMTSKEGSVVYLKRTSQNNWILYGDIMDNTNMAMTIVMS